MNNKSKTFLVVNNKIDNVQPMKCDVNVTGCREKFLLMRSTPDADEKD